MSFYTEQQKTTVLLFQKRVTVGHSADSSHTIKVRQIRFKFLSPYITKSTVQSKDGNFNRKEVFRAHRGRSKQVNKKSQEVIKEFSRETGKKEGAYWIRIERLKHKKAGVLLDKKRHKYRVRLIIPENQEAN